jgi:preprotein translocase subunit SecG
MFLVGKWLHHPHETAESRPFLRRFPMVHDLVLATIFLAMIIALALLAMRSDKEEKDAL